MRLTVGPHGSSVSLGPVTALLYGVVWLLIWVGVIVPLWLLRSAITGIMAVRRKRVTT